MKSAKISTFKVSSAKFNKIWPTAKISALKVVHKRLWADRGPNCLEIEIPVQDSKGVMKIKQVKLPL